MLSIRPATISDVPVITDIYNHAILHSTATFDTEIKTLDDRIKWFNDHQPTHPVLVAEVDGKVIGFASLSRWSERCAYDGTAEVSVYIEHNHRGKGVGKKMLEVLTLQGKKMEFHNLLSRITEGNLSSIHIHELMGYEHIGVMKQAGKKFGKFLDVHLMQRVVGNE
jgi:L-amino acid N-acyltransferase YncA